MIATKTDWFSEIDDSSLAQIDPDTLTEQEAEEVLKRLARALVPASTDLQQLTQALTEQTTDQAVPEGLSAENEAEIQLRKAQARYRALVEQIPAITFMAPLDGTTSELYVSPQIEQMLGFSAEEWLSNPILWYTQLHPDDQERWQAEFSRTLNAGEHFRSDYRFISRAGKVVWIHGEAKVISDEQGKPLFLQGVAFDITEQKEAEQKLQRNNAELARARDLAMEASRAKSAFLANMSHELRTPLHAILGFSEMLLEDALDCGQEQFVPDIQKITGSANHLVGLIGNILDLSKIEAGKMDLFLEEVDLDNLVQEVVEAVQPLAEEHGNFLQIDHTPLDTPLRADATKVRQILINLMGNACKFTESGTITLSTKRVPTAQGDRIVFRVSDTGIGIAPEHMKKLFQIFSQADESTTRKYGGTGLGLAISQRFCQMMGGKISVESILGEGSTFTVDLPTQVQPLTEQLPLLSEYVTEEKLEANEVSGPQLLVFTTDSELHEQLKAGLASQEAHLTLTDNTEDLLTSARSAPPAVILLAVTPGSSSTWTALTSLKADPELANTPVVLIALSADGEQGFYAGTHDFLTWPIDWSRLTKLLANLQGDKEEPTLLILDQQSENLEVAMRLTNTVGWKLNEADTGWAGIRAVLDNPPELLLLDPLLPDMDGFEFIRLLRTTPAGQSIPVVPLLPQEITEEQGTRLSQSLQQVLQKSPVNRETLFAELGVELARHLTQANLNQLKGEDAGTQVVSEEVGETHATPVVENHVLRHLQGLLEQVRQERDQALAELQQSAPQAPPEWLAQHEQLEAELELTRQSLREQQQMVELLQAETADAEEHYATVAQMQEEIERLRAERDATLAQKHQEELAPPIHEILSSLQQLHQELQGVRNEQGTLQKAFAIQQKKGKRRRQRKPERVAQAVESSTPAPATPPPARTSGSLAPSSLEGGLPSGTQENGWYLTYRDPHGHQHSLRGNTEEIHRWYQEGLLKGEEVLVSRNASGPFDTLRSYHEFSALGERDPKTAANGPTSSRAQPPVTPSQTLGAAEGDGARELTQASPAGTPQTDGPVATTSGKNRVVEWLTWLAPAFFALLAALVLGHLLFR